MAISYPLYSVCLYPFRHCTEALYLPQIIKGQFLTLSKAPGSINFVLGNIELGLLPSNHSISLQMIYTG